MLRVFVSLFMVCAFFVMPAAAEIKVVVSIKPLHSLVAAVMKGVGEPALLLSANTSPHDANLKPSSAKMLQNADLVFWVGGELETFLEKALSTISVNTDVTSVLELKGLNFPPSRPDSKNPHIWLDTQNALIILQAVEKKLIEFDPANANKYRANRLEMADRVLQLEREIDQQLRPVRNSAFLTFHDAFRHFENRFSLLRGSTITSNPEVKPGAGRIYELQKIIRDKNIKCIFSEPQFDKRIVDLLREKTRANTASLDPLGNSLDSGIELYPTLLRKIATGFTNCLSLK